MGDLEILQEVKDSFKRFLSDNSLNYMICSYVPNSNGTKLQLTEIGSTGLAAILDEERDDGEILSDGQVRFILLKFNVDGTIKYCLLTWRGKAAKGMLGSKCVLHANVLDKDLFHVHYIFVTDNQEEVTDEKNNGWT